MNATEEKLTLREADLLSAAQGGSENAFRDLVEPRRPELHAHCYRMLGSVHDAEDALQETLLRAWKGLPRFEGRSSFRSWMYRIATNTSLNAIEKRPKRVLPIDYGPAADPHSEFNEPVTESVWIEPYPDESLGLEDGRSGPDARYEQRESVELAFVAALQHLPANQRAALILRDVLDFSAKEVAESLDTTTASVNSALQRARETVENRIPEQSQQETLRVLGDQRLSEIVEAYSEALESGDAETVLSLLTEDATWAMPPTPSWFTGRDNLIGFLHNGPFTVEWRHIPAHANGQIAVGCYSRTEDGAPFRAHVLDVLTLSESGHVAAVTAFIDSTIFDSFGLPDQLPA